MRLKEIIYNSTEYLKRKGVPSAKYDTELLLSHVLGVSRMELYLEFDKIINPDVADVIRQSVAKRGERVPLQYILGDTIFLDCKIDVKETVLIPRPETEYMVKSIIDTCELLINENRFLHPTILDLCTGSGAIAIALKKKKNLL